VNSYLIQIDYDEKSVMEDFQADEIDNKLLKAATRRSVYMATHQTTNNKKHETSGNISIEAKPSNILRNKSLEQELNQLPSESTNRIRLNSTASVPTGEDLIEFVQNRFSTLQDYFPVAYYDRESSTSGTELQRLLQRPLIGKYLKYVMKSLDTVVSTPFCYLAKKSDPISLQLAVHYIVNNELTNNIYVLHFVDDRKLIAANLQYVKVLKKRTTETTFR
jgi:hypothetical protein